MACVNGFRNQVEPAGLQTTRGIGEELILRLREIGGTARPAEGTYPHEPHSDTRGDLSYCYVVDTEKLKYVMLAMIAEAGIRVLFHTWFSRPILDPAHRSRDAGRRLEGQRDNPRIAGVIVENKSGRQAFLSDVTVDATGDGDVAARSGARFRQVRHSEAPRLTDSLMYQVGGVPDIGRVHGCAIDDRIVLWGPGVGAIDGVDAEELTRAEIRARLAVYRDLEDRAAGQPGLRGARIVQTPPLLGIRQTRFIEGLYRLTGEDVLAGRRFEDCVALGVNPVIHYYGYRRFLEHEGYDIPYRSLLPRDVDGLIVAGRCISSDQVAYESWRAMAHVLAIGEGAGTAAALSAADGVEPKRLDVERLQERLVRQGAEIGQSRRDAAPQAGKAEEAGEAGEASLQTKE
jgi:hypothetical protein